MEGIAKEKLPSGIEYEWTSTAYQEKVAGNLSYIIFAMSLVLVYLILSGQYENWLIPTSIILACL